MTELAITDDLTKLFNTRYLNRTIEVEIQRASRYNTSVALIFMDIDHFKVINDSYAPVGSKVLVEMGQLLLKSLRTIDIVARYGGDEFVIVLPQTPPQSAAHIAERMRKSIELFTFLKKEGYSLKLTAGLALLHSRKVLERRMSSYAWRTKGMYPGNTKQETPFML